MDRSAETKIIIADYHDAGHSADIVYLLDGYAQDPMGGGEPLSEFVKQNLVTELAKRPYAFSLLAYVDNKPAALVNCFDSFSSFSCKPLINIHDVIVLSEFRGKGISHLMIQKVDKIAREKGCCKITLEVLEGNIAAKNSYLKEGFAGYELDPKMGRALFWQKPID